MFVLLEIRFTTTITKQRSPYRLLTKCWEFLRVTNPRAEQAKDNVCAGGQDSCTTCMTWALKGLNEDVNSQLGARLYTWGWGLLRGVLYYTNSVNGWWEHSIVKLLVYMSQILEGHIRSAKKMGCMKALTPEIRFDIFDTTIRPIIMYGSDVSGFSKNGLQGRDKLFLNYIRCVLCIKATTSNIIVFGECGKFPPISTVTQIYFAISTDYQRCITRARLNLCLMCYVI